MLTTISVKVFISSIVVCIISSLICKAIDMLNLHEKSTLIKVVLMLLFLMVIVSAFITFVSFFCVIFGITYNFIF